MSHELEAFLSTWSAEAPRTLSLLKTLPSGSYDFRPYPRGRTIGELAWHLAGIEGMVAHGVQSGRFDFKDRPAGLEAPRTVAELAPGYERVHAEAIVKVRQLQETDLDRVIPFFGGRPMPIRRILWDALLHHSLHHRGQLAMVCRLAGGTPPGLYGPTLEETEAMKAKV